MYTKKNITFEIFCTKVAKIPNYNQLSDDEWEKLYDKYEDYKRRLK
jgi:hypothetical protein